MQEQAVAKSVSSTPPVEFLWLELTNRCNLQCTHCYADSGPQAEKGTISTSRYIELMTDAFALGCRRVQFIGGEPTLYRDLPVLIRTASQMGFEFIEVYTNLTILPEALLECFVENGVHVATSVYGPAGKPHDAITLVDGSWEKTTRNLRRVVHAGLPVRASIVEMETNAGYTDSTVSFLKGMGVENVGVDRIRHIGRGAACNETGDMSQLCGRCAGSTLCVSPTGVVSPCIMSKKWSVGTIAETSLSDIATGNSLRETRHRIYEAVAAKPAGAACPPSFANRHAGCPPSYHALAEKPACHPPFALAEKPACHPAFALAEKPACPPQFALAADNADANCRPTSVAAADRLACQPTFSEAINAAADTLACGPALLRAADNANANCRPTFVAAADGPSCPPTFAPYQAAIDRHCHPTFAPAYDTAVDTPACNPSFVPVTVQW